MGLSYKFDGGTKMPITFTASDEAASTILQGGVAPGLALAKLATIYQFRDVSGNELAVGTTPLGRALRGEVFQDYDVMVRAADGHDLVVSTSGAPLSASAPKMVKASMPPIIRKSPCAKFSVWVVENVT